jgi:murein DD-endopeptidase MepM/ murein hydrolase activator NlpD
VQRAKRGNALTILLIPHSERAPVSLRLPLWLAPVLSLVLVAAMVAAVVFGLQYYSLQQQVSELLSEQATERVRQREMRATILSQQDEVRSLSTQVEGFKAELLSVRRLSDEIRDILGIQAPAPTEQAVPAPTAPSGGGESQSWASEDSSTGAGGARLAVRPSSRSMRMAVERSNEVAGMRSAVPAEVQLLQELRELVLERMARIQAGEHGDWETLQGQLRQWAAAPHLWPVYPHPITSEFGYRELRGVYGFHYGLDMGCWTGTPVRATKDGTVTAASWRGSLGLTVEIAHDSGYSTLYAHLSSVQVRVGDQVKAGDVIALSGNSGNSTGPHLHYEIHLYGNPVDPLRYIDEG